MKDDIKGYVQKEFEQEIFPYVYRNNKQTIIVDNNTLKVIDNKYLTLKIKPQFEDVIQFLIDKEILDILTSKETVKTLEQSFYKYLIENKQ